MSDKILEIISNGQIVGGGEFIPYSGSPDSSKFVDSYLKNLEKNKVRRIIPKKNCKKRKVPFKSIILALMIGTGLGAVGVAQYEGGSIIVQKVISSGVVPRYVYSENYSGGIHIYYDGNDIYADEFVSRYYEALKNAGFTDDECGIYFGIISEYGSFVGKSTPLSQFVAKMEAYSATKSKGGKMR